MFSDKVRLYFKILTFFPPYLFTLLKRRLYSIYHSLTYAPTPNPKNVVILGGSFAGIELAKLFVQSLPTGYRVVLIEKNSHFNFLFNFPRYAVLEGREQKAFFPYDFIGKNAPKGIFTFVQDSVHQVLESEVRLASGERIEYAYLAIASGCSASLPARVTSPEREKACEELRGLQKKIKQADKIAVVGGGAVGIELATDIKTFYPEKEVLVVHSRGQLLNLFGRRLHNHVMEVLQKLEIRVMLNERPPLAKGTDGQQKTLRFADGHEELFDFIIPCTGQTPNSSIIVNFLPDSVSKTSKQILVKPNLQVSGDISTPQNVFALGDVAESGGPKMARAAHFQSQIVASNILALIKGQQPAKVYKPQIAFEGAIKLSLGKTQNVIYTMDDSGKELLISGNNGKLDLEVEKARKMYG